MDYFSNFDEKLVLCRCCNDCYCEKYMNCEICKDCMRDYSNELSIIYYKIKNYYDNIEKYNIDFVKSERAKANDEINQLKIKYKIN